MRYLLLIALCFTSHIYADEDDKCNIVKKKDISFRDNNSKDILEVSLIGETCRTADLKLRILTLEGSVIYDYKFNYKVGLNSVYGPEDERIDKQLNYLLKNAIGNSSKLPKRERDCDENNNCWGDGYFPGFEIYTRSDIGFKEYEKIQKEGIPTLNHSVGREAWETFVYDKKNKNVISVFFTSV